MRRVEIILGPTAAGKTAYSIRKAQEYGCPIINCDSRQLYQKMTIGTAVPSEEELAAVKHYFIQTLPVDAVYTAGKYELDALKLVNKLFADGNETIIMTGGSMLYIDAFCYGLDCFPDVPPQYREQLMECLETEGVGVLAEQLRELDPDTAAEIDLSNGQRVVRALEVCLYTGRPFSSFKSRSTKDRDFEIVKTGLTLPREELYERIDKRVLDMMDRGLLEEVRSLLPYRDCPALQTVGYKELFDYLDGKTTLDEAVRLIQRNTRHYAKRQMTWWRRSTDINWLPRTGI